METKNREDTMDDDHYTVGGSGSEGGKHNTFPSPGVCLLCITIIIIPTMQHHPSPQSTPVHLTTQFSNTGRFSTATQIIVQFLIYI